MDLRAWVACVRDCVSICVGGAGIADAVSIAVFLARVGSVDTVVFQVRNPVEVCVHQCAGEPIPFVILVAGACEAADGVGARCVFVAGVGAFRALVDIGADDAVSRIALVAGAVKAAVGVGARCVFVAVVGAFRALVDIEAVVKLIAREVGVEAVAGSVPVGVEVAGVADAVTVAVRLFGICIERAVVVQACNAIAIGVRVQHCYEDHVCVDAADVVNRIKGDLVDSGRCQRAAGRVALDDLAVQIRFPKIGDRFAAAGVGRLEIEGLARENLGQRCGGQYVHVESDLAFDGGGNGGRIGVAAVPGQAVKNLTVGLFPVRHGAGAGVVVEVRDLVRVLHQDVLLVERQSAVEGAEAVVVPDGQHHVVEHVIAVGVVVGHVHRAAASFPQVDIVVLDNRLTVRRMPQVAGDSAVEDDVLHRQLEVIFRDSLHVDGPILGGGFQVEEPELLIFTGFQLGLDRSVRRIQVVGHVRAGFGDAVLQLGSPLDVAVVVDVGYHQHLVLTSVRARQAGGAAPVARFGVAVIAHLARVDNAVAALDAAVGVGVAAVFAG